MRDRDFVGALFALFAFSFIWVFVLITVGCITGAIESSLVVWKVLIVVSGSLGAGTLGASVNLLLPRWIHCMVLPVSVDCE